MNGAQRVIKGLALALAVVIMVSVLSAVVGAGMILTRVFGGGGVARQDVSEWNETVVNDKWEFNELRIELKSTSLKLERGEEFQVVADEEVIETRQAGKTVYIEEKERGWWGWWNEIGGEVKVVLPEDVDLTKFALDMGAGAAYVKGMAAEEVELSLGAGRAEFEGLKATRRAKVDGGAGLLIIRGAELKGLDLDMGVGRVEIEAMLGGDSEISAGVGKLDLTLIGEEDDYRVKFDPGLGAMNHEGISLDNSEGKNLVEIDGGVGAIDIRLRTVGDRT